MADFKRILDASKEVEINPSSFLRPVFEAVEEAIENEFNLVTVNNPWLNLLEASSTMTVAAMEKANVLTRRQYRNLAQTEEDLYPHMSDRDFVGRFSKPSKTLISFATSYEWILNSAVLNTTTNERYLIIPKDTVWSVNGNEFYQYYAIKIEVLDSGDIQSYLVVTSDNELYTPVTKLIEYSTVYADGQKLINFNIPVEQLSYRMYREPITSNGFYLSQPFTDNFYYVKAYVNNAGVWRKVKTTHDMQTYDPLEVTVVVKVTDGKIEAKVPDVYINNGLAGSEIMLMVYTTKADIELDLSTLSPSDWSVAFDDVFDNESEHWEAFAGADVKIIYSLDKTRGGSKGLTFEELKANVVYNKYGKQTSVTFDELTVDMKNKGYGVYREKDTISERVYVATRAIDKPKVGFISSPPAVACKEVLYDNNRNDIGDYVVRNGSVTTLKPGALFKNVGLDIAILSETERNALTALSPVSLAGKLNEDNYYYTPFYYVLDSTTPVFSSRAYYLDDPKRLSTSFVNFNGNITYVVTTVDAKGFFDGDRYNIEIVCEHPTDLTGLVVQMRYVDSTGTALHLNAVQQVVSSTRSVFVFQLDTTLNISPENRIEVTSLLDVNGDATSTFVDLTSEFEFIYLVEDGVVTPSPFDSSINTSGLPNTVSGVTYDKVTFELGIPLDNLNSRSRSILSPGVPKLRTSDNPKIYEKDVYLRDDSGRVFEITEDGVNFEILHNAGEQEVDQNGNLQYHWRKNDPVLDDDNLIVYDVAPYTSRRIRFFLVDAKYLFATSSEVIEYSKEIPKLVVQYLKDIATLTPTMLERTTLLFEPTSTAVSTLVEIDGGRQMATNTAVKFNVKYTMIASRYNDIQLREAIQDSTKKAIAEFIDRNEFSMSDLISELNKISSGIIRNVEVYTSLPSGISKIVEESARFTIRSRIVPTQNRQLTIEDDIEIELTK